MLNPTHVSEQGYEQGGSSHSAVDRPYMSLWASVFRLGITDFCTARARSEKANAVRRPYEKPSSFSSTEPYLWFYSDDAHTGSFVWLCELFSINPTVARDRVLGRWRDSADVEALKLHGRRTK